MFEKLRYVLIIFLLCVTPSIAYAELEEMSNSELREVRAQFDLTKDQENVLDGNNLYESIDYVQNNYDNQLLNTFSETISDNRDQLDIYAQDGNVHVDIGSDLGAEIIKAFVKAINQRGIFNVTRDAINATEKTLAATEEEN